MCWKNMRPARPQKLTQVVSHQRSLFEPYSKLSMGGPLCRHWKFSSYQLKPWITDGSKRSLKKQKFGCVQQYDASKSIGFKTAFPALKWLINFRYASLWITGWWFGCHEFYFPINIGFLIIPIDEVIFFRGVAKNHQPDKHMFPSGASCPMFLILNFSHTFPGEAPSPNTW